MKKLELFKTINNLEVTLANLDRELERHKQYEKELQEYRAKTEARLVYLRKRLVCSCGKLEVAV